MCLPGCRADLVLLHTPLAVLPDVKPTDSDEADASGTSADGADA